MTLKKILRAAVCALLTVVLLSACTTATISYPNIGDILSKLQISYEKTTYLIEVGNGRIDADKEIWTTPQSFMTIEFERISDKSNMARVTMEMQVIYKDLINSSYAKERQGKTDLMGSTVEFFAFGSGDFMNNSPVRVTKYAQLTTAPTKSYAYEFDYAGDNAGKGTFTDHEGTQSPISIKDADGLYDNEQLFFLLAFVFEKNTDASGLKPQLGYSASLDVANIHDHVRYSRSAYSLQFNIGSDKTEYAYDDLLYSKGGFVPVSLYVYYDGLQTGTPINLNYTLDDTVSVDGQSLVARRYLVAGMEQNTYTAQSVLLSKTSYILKDYTN